MSHDKFLKKKPKLNMSIIEHSHITWIPSVGNFSNMKAFQSFYHRVLS